MQSEEDIRRAVVQTAAQLQDDVSRHMTALAESLTAALDAVSPPGAPAAAAPPAAATESALAERLVDGVRAIGRARTLTETLDTLVACAGREALRVGLLLVRGPMAVGWRFLGFDSTFDTAGRIAVPRTDSGVIGDALASGAAAAAVGRAPQFAGLPPGHESLAVPIVIGGDAVAVLYADQAGADEYAAGWTHTIEALARDASHALEALTAITAARFLTAQAAGSRTVDAPSGERVVDDEHAAARRYARLLVSEIKLYHEPQVVAARRERDLLSRLGGEIARARSLDDQRVPADVRQQADYFHAEIVRTLADGDPNVLGTSA